MSILSRPAGVETPAETVRPIVTTLVHDLRQPLSVIAACADYLKLVLPAADSRAHEHLELLHQQVGEANRILHDAVLELLYTGASRETAPSETVSSRSLTNAASPAVTY